MTRHKSDPFTGRSKQGLPALTSIGDRRNSVQEVAEELGVPQRHARKVVTNPDKHSIGGTRIA